MMFFELIVMPNRKIGKKAMHFLAFMMFFELLVIQDRKF